MEPVLTRRPPHTSAFWKPNVSHRTPPPTYAAEVRPASTETPPLLDDALRIATYNVHRWTGVRGGDAWVPERAASLIATLDADVIALQEVLRPNDHEDPLPALADALDYHVAFVTSRTHRNGTLGNALLSRWPFEEALAVDLSFSRVEQRVALAVELDAPTPLAFAATHLAILDRTRKRQVEALLSHPSLQGPVVLMGDLNAWRRRGAASRKLAAAFETRHHNQHWPPSYPSSGPMLALDRIYARGARLLNIRTVRTNAARKASDHLPVVADLVL
ncbi:MAG: endonuclease/exonuclease/phosphatase family protein [Bacteroidota bacterium]